MSYKVTDSRELRTMTQGGSEKTEYRVWLVTGNGASGTVDVPQDKWNDKDLPAILEAKALNLDLAFAVANGSE